MANCLPEYCQSDDIVIDLQPIFSTNQNTLPFTRVSHAEKN